MTKSMPPAIAYCVAENLMGSGSEFYRVHRPAHVIGNQLNWITLVSSRFAAPETVEPFMVEVEGTAFTPNVVILRPSVVTQLRPDDDYSSIDPGEAWEQMRSAVERAQKAGQIVLLDLDDHPYAWNEYHAEDRITAEQWRAYDAYVDQFNAVLCSTKYLAEKVMAPRHPAQRFEYAPNLYDPWRYDPSRAKFGPVIGSHIYVKARDQADFDQMKELGRWMSSHPSVRFLHIGDEFPCGNCDHAETHHFEGQFCDDCACEIYVAPSQCRLATKSDMPAASVICIAPVNPWELHESLTYNVGIVPLADSVWNYAKTEGKGFEMAAAGIPFVALTGNHPLYHAHSKPLTRIDRLTCDERFWQSESKGARQWAVDLAKEHQVEHLSTMTRLSNSNLAK